MEQWVTVAIMVPVVVQVALLYHPIAATQTMTALIAPFVSKEQGEVSVWHYHEEQVGLILKQ